MPSLLFNETKLTIAIFFNNFDGRSNNRSNSKLLRGSSHKCTSLTKNKLNFFPRNFPEQAGFLTFENRQKSCFLTVSHESGACARCLESINVGNFEYCLRGPQLTKRYSSEKPFSFRETL